MKQLMRFELKKIFMKRIVRMAVLGLLILNILFVFSDYYSMYAFGRQKPGGERRSGRRDRSGNIRKISGPFNR